MEEDNIFDIQDASQSNEAPEANSTNKKVWVVLIVLLGFMLVGIGGYWLGAQSNLSENPKLSDSLSVQQQKPTKLPTPTSIPITQESSQDLPEDWVYKSCQVPLRMRIVSETIS